MTQPCPYPLPPRRPSPPYGPMKSMRMQTTDATRRHESQTYAPHHRFAAPPKGAPYGPPVHRKDSPNRQQGNDPKPCSETRSHRKGRTHTDRHHRYLSTTSPANRTTHRNARCQPLTSHGGPLPEASSQRMRSHRAPSATLYRRPTIHCQTTMPPHVRQAVVNGDERPKYRKRDHKSK